MPISDRVESDRAYPAHLCVSGLSHAAHRPRGRQANGAPSQRRAEMDSRMLSIYGNSPRFCDGVSRRNFLKIGALGVAGLSLPQILRAEAEAGTRRPHKAV